MADLAITVEAGGVLATLADIEARSRDLTPVWEGHLDPALRTMFAEIWKTEGAAIGHTWAPLSPLTLMLKEARGRKKMGVLRDSDQIFRSLTVRSHPAQIKEVRPDGMTFGTGVNADGVPYPALQNEGWTMSTVFGRLLKGAHFRDVPARPFLPDADEIPTGTLTTIRDALAAYVTDGTV